MNVKTIVLLLSCIIYFSFSKIIYFEPSDGAKLVNIENNIIIGFDKALPLDENDINNCLTVDGSLSGRHAGRVLFTRDSRKIIFVPVTYFSPGEKVTVTMSGKLSKINGSVNRIKYHFETSGVKPNVNRRLIRAAELGTDANKLENPVFNNPPAVPTLTVTVNNNPENGYIFLGNFYAGIYMPHLIIADKNGLLYYYQQRNELIFDFKKQPSGTLTFFEDQKNKFYELNSGYNLIDSFYTGNGYETDEHELRLLSNRHALLMSYDYQIIDMRHIVPGGDSNATVIGLIIQEIDENKNVIFQWRSWDHFQITDALHENLTASPIDYVHGNAIEIDNDSNLIISSRNMDEITKINRTTGAIIWRWGGRNNQFTFINDSLRFTYQHAIRRIANGNVTMYDNGNFHTPKFSRALEYTLDEVNKTATLVWEYKHTPLIYAAAMGYVQRLPGGNTLIGWGTSNTTVTEVTPQKTIAFEMKLPTNIFTYRIFKYSWNGSPTSQGNQNSNVPLSFDLYQNYPNPFNPSTIITFELPHDVFTELTVTDVTGRLVKNLVSEKLKAGKHEFNFDGSNYSSGVYFYTLKSGAYISTKKMILLK